MLHFNYAKYNCHPIIEYHVCHSDRRLELAKIERIDLLYSAEGRSLTSSLNLWKGDIN